MDHSKGYNPQIEGIRDKEFPSLKGITYVDHVGTTLYAQSQMEAFLKDVSSNVYGNPHTRSQSSQLTTDTIDQVRFRVLKFFNASPEEYCVIFTSGCTGALKLVAETFAFADTKASTIRGDNSSGHGEQANQVSNGCFVYLLDNHTSVQGMRELVCDRVLGSYCINVDEMDKVIPESYNQASEIKQNCEPQTSGETTKCNLFAYPAQSNFSGRKYPFNWIDKIHRKEMGFQKSLQGDWYVVLDAASYVSTSQLDLQTYKPDFVTVSFYKIFGFPTGLGALLVKNSSSDRLQKRYFGGGTVAVSDAKLRFHVFRPGLAERFEDGTPPFLDIVALRHGLDAIERLAGGMLRASEHAYTVAKYFHDNLTSLCHGNGTPAAEVYSEGFTDPRNQGQIVSFNLLRANKQFIGFAEVDKLAQLYNIHLRTGCFCNIGACQKHLNLTSQQIKENFDAGHVCGDDRDMIDGQPTGSVRISFGYMSTFQDAQNCLKFITECFLEGAPVGDISLPKVKQTQAVFTQESKEDKYVSSENGSVCNVENFNTELREKEKEVLVKCSDDARFLIKISLFPIKSCAAFEVSEWDIGRRGLLYDREWMVVGESGVTLGQKREPKLCLLRPHIDLLTNTLIINFPDMPPFRLSMCVEQDSVSDVEVKLCTNKVCGNRVNTVDCGDAVSDWLSRALDRPQTRLLRQKQEDTRTGKRKDVNSQEPAENTRLSLANESQFLLVSRESVKSLYSHISDQTISSTDETELNTQALDIDNMAGRFRGNLIIGGGPGFDEDSWTQVKIGDNLLISQGQCSRCQMVCVDPRTGERSNEPLRTIAAWRGKKAPFGVYFRLSPSSTQDDGSGVMGTVRIGDEVIPEVIEKN